MTEDFTEKHNKVAQCRHDLARARQEHTEARRVRAATAEKLATEMRAEDARLKHLVDLAEIKVQREADYLRAAEAELERGFEAS